MTKIIIDKNVMVPMGDGVKLATDIYRLDNSPPSPVLVVRTPYNKDNLVSHNDTFNILRAVESGYTVMAQDVRGRYASEGKFNPHFQETPDGVDAYSWAASQPWCDGSVGTFGGSYLGAAQWLPAGQQPESLRAMAPSMTFSDAYEGCSYQGGAKVLHDLRWVVADIVPAEINRRIKNGENVTDGEFLPDVDTALTELPLAAHPFIKKYAPFYLDWLSHSEAGEFWEQASPKTGYSKIKVPALNITGWYDIFLWSTLQNYIGMKEHGASEEARKNQRLIIGPWSHINFSGSFPEMEFGFHASSLAVDLPGIHLNWFDKWLKGIGNGIDQEPPVMIFVMGTNQWRKESGWPVPGTEYQPFYLNGSGKANTLNGGGILSTEPQGNESPDKYVFDPLEPVPTVGGQVLLPGGNATGPRDQRTVETRDDVLVYTTTVLDKPAEVIGPIELHLFVSSSAPDTDFTGKLVDVFPDGRAIILTEGILRARYRNSFTAPELLEPGEIYEITINLWTTGNVFLSGHSIRLEVSSSNFPRFNRNSNTGGFITMESRYQYQKAENTVFHDEAHPSRLILPIISK
ncbi:MAG: CocE/NonD family hydrolase [Desulfobacteraceae bacterium]|jgi:putative CocE/NonD family hydrolase